MSDDTVIDVIPDTPPTNGAAGNPAPSPDMAGLLSALAGGGDPLSVLLSTLQGQGSANPTASLLAAFMQNRKPPIETVVDPEPEDPRVLEQQSLGQNARERALLELQETVSKLYGELESLRKRNDELAAALGACFLCFGSDPLCSECAGRGRPGAKLPEPTAYRKYVVPAVRRVQMRTTQQIHSGKQLPARPAQLTSSERNISP